MTELFSPLVERAIEVAAEWHDGTYRKGRWSDPCVQDPGGTPSRVPAMAHVTTVALTVQRAGWGDDAVAAAFLHDALEDANRHGDTLARATLVALVGETVTRIVEAVSEPKRDADGAWLPWRVRKEAYLAALAAGPVEAVAVSLADKLHNAYSMASSLETGIDIFTSAPGRRGLSAGAVDQRWFFEAVLDESRSADDPRLVPMRERLRVEVARFVAAAGIG
ncbi:HD domain-containing protein [Rubrivirga sp.]|uniref:HD domain-containing protein n=1 Tax=Rubrivirga sp. TaxID=1885344 RepID=UPI003B5254FB